MRNVQEVWYWGNILALEKMDLETLNFRIYFPSGFYSHTLAWAKNQFRYMWE